MSRDRQTLLRDALDQRQQREADINYRIYVNPLGDSGLHVVKNRREGVEFKVSGPKTTFRPDTIVPTGSHTGEQGEEILREAPPGRRGNLAAPPSTEYIASPAPIVELGFGAFPFTSSSSPAKISNLGIFGQNFSPTNFVEIFEERSSGEFSEGSIIEGYFLLTGMNYVSATDLQIAVQTTANAIAFYSFRVRVWNAAPPEGTLSSQQEYTEGLSDFFDIRYWLEGT